MSLQKDTNANLELFLQDPEYPQLPMASPFWKCSVLFTWQYTEVSNIKRPNPALFTQINNFLSGHSCKWTSPKLITQKLGYNSHWYQQQLDWAWREKSLLLYIIYRLAQFKLYLKKTTNEYLKYSDYFHFSKVNQWKYKIHEIMVYSIRRLHLLGSLTIKYIEPDPVCSTQIQDPSEFNGATWRVRRKRFCLLSFPCILHYFPIAKEYSYTYSWCHFYFLKLNHYVHIVTDGRKIQGELGEKKKKVKIN